MLSIFDLHILSLLRHVRRLPMPNQFMIGTIQTKVTNYP